MTFENSQAIDFEEFYEPRHPGETFPVPRRIRDFDQVPNFAPYLYNYYRRLKENNFFDHKYWGLRFFKNDFFVLIPIPLTRLTGSLFDFLNENRGTLVLRWGSFFVFVYSAWDSLPPTPKKFDGFEISERRNVFLGESWVGMLEEKNEGLPSVFVSNGKFTPIRSVNAKNLVGHLERIKKRIEGFS